MSEPTKLAFGFAKSKAQTKIAVNVKEDAEKRVLVVGMSGSTMETLGGDEDNMHAAVKVIPKQENTLVVGARKYVPSFVPEAESAMPTDGTDKFELAAVAAPVVQQYGLVQSSRGKRKDAASREEHDEVQRKKYKEEIDQLPEACTEEAYESMPVEEFGRALFRGMGWNDGEGVGKKRQNVEIKGMVQRPERLGLGAKPAMLAAKDKREQEKAAAAAARRGEGVPRQAASTAEAAEPPERSPATAAPPPASTRAENRTVEGIQVGKIIAVIAGKHKGAACEVLKLLPQAPGRSGRALVRLQPGGDSVEVRCKELGEPVAERRRDEERAGPSGRQREGASKSKQRRQSSSEEEEEEEQGHKGRTNGHASRPTWLATAIRVRVVDKRVKGGRLLSKKGTVLDVHPGALADVKMDDNREVVQVHESSLETVVPRSEGVLVLIVRGALRGRRARLLRKNAETQLAAVQLDGEEDIERLPLDDVAEYVGGEEH